MNRMLRMRLYAFVLAVGMVFPMLRGFAHALHEHDNKVCLAQNESHIHSEGISCDHMHYFNPSGTFDPLDTTPLLLFDLYDSRSFEALGKKGNSHFNTFALRAPPSINV